MGAAAVVVDEGGKFDERHAFEEVDFEQAVVVLGEGRAHVFAAVVAAVAKGAEEHVAVEEGLAVDSHADIVAARGEDAADDAGGVGVLAADDGFATHVVANLAHHGIEAEVADVDAVTRRTAAGNKRRTAVGVVVCRRCCGGVYYLHYVHRMGSAVHEALQVVEVFQRAVVFDVVVATARGVAADLDGGAADGATDHFVQRAVAAAGVEADFLGGVFVAPLAYPAGGIALALGHIYLVVEIGVRRGVGLHSLGDGRCGVLFAGAGIYDK